MCKEPSIDEERRRRRGLYDRCMDNREYRDRINTLYGRYSGLLDRDFLSKIKNDLPARYSELYFCHVFSKRLHLKIEHRGDNRLDLFLPGINSWAEITTLTNGKSDSPDYVPVPNMEDVQSVPIRKGTIKNGEGVILCINGGWLNGNYGAPCYPVGGCPEIVQVLYGIGNPTCQISRETGKVVDVGLTTNFLITKTTADHGITEFDIGYFFGYEYSRISAVIYSYRNVMDPIGVGVIGSDFIVVHNPFALNPIPRGTFKCGIEYFAERISDEEIKITKYDYLTKYGWHKWIIS